MAANMLQQMGAGGPAPPRRPMSQNLQTMVYTSIVNNTLPYNGWQATVPANIRTGNVMNLISNTMLAMPQSDQPAVVNASLNYEADAFGKSPDKAQYDQKINARLQDFFRKRQANEPHIQNSLQQHMAQTQAQQMMMTPQLQAQMAARGMLQPGQQGFQHLQQQMQASPIPHQPQPQMGMGMQNPAANPMNPSHQAMQMGAQQMRPSVPYQQQQMLANAHRYAMTRFNQTAENEKNNLRMRLQGLPPQQLQQFTQNGQDPVIGYYQQQILKQLMHKQQMIQQPGVALNPELGHFSNAEIMNQQKAGLMAQEAGQMVVPASGGPGRNPTPQPNPQGLNQPMQQRPPHMQQQQQFNMQQAQQLKMDQAAQQSQAQIRAQAQAKQMQGQPGGLSGPIGVSQSPGMNTLNAPVPRPPVAMGQERPQPQMNPGNGPFGQNLDPRFNQNQRPQMGNNMNGNHNADAARNQMLRNVMASMGPEQQAALRNMPPAEVNKFLMMKARAASQMGGRPPSQLGQFVGPANPMVQFPPGTPMGQPMGMGAQNNLQIQQQLNRMQAANAQGRPQLPPGAVALMDQMDVPQKVMVMLHTQYVQVNWPPEIKKWGHLKQWVATNPGSPPNLPGILMGIQMQQFKAVMHARNGNNAILQQAGGKPPGPQPAPGQMPQQPPTGLENVTVTPQEIQSMRNMDQYKTWPEDQLRKYLITIKQQHKQKQQASQPQQPSQQPSQPSPNPATTPVPNSQVLGGPTGPQRLPNTGPEQTGSAAAARANKQPSNNNRQTPQQNASPAMPPKNGLKRPSSDDVVEVPNPSGTPVQRPQSQQPHPGANLPNFSPAQIANMSPEQRQKYEQMRNRQGQSSSLGQEAAAMAKLRQIAQEEHRLSAQEVMPDIPMTPEQYAHTCKTLLHIWSQMGKLGLAMGRWYALTLDDDRARTYFKMRMRLAKQMKDEKMTGLKPVLTMGPQHLESYKTLLEGMYRDLKSIMPKNNKQQGTPESTPQPGATAATPTAQPAPLNAANLEKNTQALSKMHQRSGSISDQPPPAPTTAQNRFSFSALSPHGQPSYAGKPAVTQDNLHLPPAHARKKARTGANASPQAQVNMLRVGDKQPSPEMQKRQQLAEVKLQFQCSEPGCDMHPMGFATDAALQTHMMEEHIKPRQDPEKFAIGSFADYLGLDVDGKPKVAIDNSNNVKSVPMASNLSRQGQNHPTAMPMARGSPMIKQESSTGSQATDAFKSAASKAVRQPTAADMFFGNTIDPQDLYHNMGLLESGGGGAISNMDVYRSITPNDTPESSKDSALSEPNSDVSEGVGLNVYLDLGMDEWEPFGGTHFGNSMDPAMDAGDFPAMGDQVGDHLIHWDDVHNDFNTEVKLDMSMYSLDTTC